MSQIDIPVPYSEFAESVCDLSPGSLDRFSSKIEKTWAIDANLQIQCIKSNKGKGFSATMTDGQSLATILFPSLQNTPMAIGSVVQLSGMEIYNNTLRAVDIEMIVDAAVIDCPIVDSGAMREISISPLTSSSSSSSSSSAPDLFQSYLTGRKRPVESDALCSASKSQPVTGVVEKPPIVNPMTQLDLISLSLITQHRENFIVGPVLVVELNKGELSREGKQRPTAMRLVDHTGAQIVYSTFSDFADVDRIFSERQSCCYFIGRGVAVPAFRVTIHPCEVGFEVMGKLPVRSDSKLLTVREGSDHQFRWLLQELRKIDQPVSWDPFLRNNPSNTLSVIDAIDAQSGLKRLAGITVTGIIDTVVSATTKSGAAYYRVKMIGRRSSGADIEHIQFSVWSNMHLTTGQLIELVGRGGYDRCVSLRNCIAISASDITIDPTAQFKINAGSAMEIKELANFDENQTALVSTTSFTSLPVVKLAELYTQQPGVPATVYLVSAHVTELRPFQTRAGATINIRKMTYMDDSKDANGSYCRGSTTAWPSDPIAPLVVSAGVEEVSAFTAGSKSGGHYNITEHHRVVVFKAMNVMMQSAETGKNYISFRDAKCIAVTPDDKDIHAEKLRRWFIESGHLNFVALSALDKDYVNKSNDYTAMDQSLPSMLGASSSSSASHSWMDAINNALS